MKYQIIGENELSLENILKNRGINDPIKYLNLTWDDVNSYTWFGNSLKQAGLILLRTIKANLNSAIIVD